MTQQTTPDGAVWNYDYSPVDPDNPQQPGQPPVISTGGFTGPEGIQVGAQFGAGLLDYYSQNGRSTYLQWDGMELARLHHPEGNNVSYTYRTGEKVSEAWEGKPGSASRRSRSRRAGRRARAAPRSPARSATSRSGAGIIGATRPITPTIRPMAECYRDRSGSERRPPADALRICGPPRLGQQWRRLCAGNRSDLPAGEEELLHDRRRVRSRLRDSRRRSRHHLRLRARQRPQQSQAARRDCDRGRSHARTCYGYDRIGNKVSTTRPSGACQ